VKKSWILVVAVLLTAGLAWAEEPVASNATSDASFLATVAAADAAPQEGGCELPDLEGLSADEAEAALREAGFSNAPADAAVPACPVRFKCTSLTNCGIGPVCGVTDIGPCCGTGGLIRCCTFGSIKVTTCPCECTAFACLLSCVNSSNVQFSCS